MKKVRSSLFSASVVGFAVGGLIFIGDAPDYGPIQPANASDANLNPGSSPDGSTITFTSSNGVDSDYVLDGDGSDPADRVSHVIRDLVYGQGGGMPLLLDLYLPEEATPPSPALIFIFHWGGGGQARRHFARQAAYLAERGVASAIISYRSAGPATFPAGIEDSKAAVRWLRANGKDYGIDPDKIGAVGGSAGGQLAALLRTSGGVTELEGTGGHRGYSSRVNLVIVFNGMFDLVELHEHSILRGDLEMAGIVEAYVGGTPGQSPLAYEAASAITHVDGLDPPALLLHGSSDELVPFEQSLRFKEALEDAGVPVELFVAEGATHGFFNNPPYFQETLDRMEAFVAKYFESD